jgi:polygalacturonase
LPVGVGRDKPVPPPALPAPILDGREDHRPDSPDCGFQQALDALAAKGGTLRLPGGRYQLAKALRLPPKVTLAGQGIGTALHAAEGYKGSLIVSANAPNAALRDCTILSRYDPQAARTPAIVVSGTPDAQIEGVDIRGWEGEGIRVSDSSGNSDNQSRGRAFTRFVPMCRRGSADACCIRQTGPRGK